MLSGLRVFLAFLLIILIDPGPAPAGTGAGRPSVGLVLSGGGARGAAHVGVLRVLEEYRVPVDYIAGTSMGAIVGGLYAAGYSVDDLEDVVRQIDWEEVFDDRTQRRERSFRRKRDDDLFLVRQRPGFSGGKLKFPPGVLDGQKIDLMLKRLTLPVAGVHDFDELSIPYRAVAADLETGDAVVLGGGDLALAIRASMSIPIVFAPREIDGRLLIDGGISSNLPIDVVREMGADIVIAVDISTPLEERDRIHGLPDVAGQLTTIMTRRNADKQIRSLTDRDIFIRPDLGDITTASFGREADAIPRGIEAARSVGDRLSGLSVPDSTWRRRRGDGLAPESRPVVDEVRIVNQSRLSDGVILARLDVETGRPLDVDRVEQNIGQIYGLELFESVYYDVSREEGRGVMTVSARETSWGPNYIQFGVVIYDDYEGPNFNVAAAYTRTAVNRLNGEWRTGVQLGREPGIFTEFFQPFDRRLKWFAGAKLFAGEETWNVFDDGGDKLSELGIRRYGVDAAVGRELGTWGEIRAGYLREAGTIRIQVGDPGTPETRFDTGVAYVQLFLDELDDVRFPRGGVAARVRLSAGREALGSDTDYEQALATATAAYSKGRNTGVVSGSFGTSRDADAPVQSLFALGGLTRLSGYELNELRGQHFALLSGIVYRRLVDSGMAPLYAGLSAEYGNVFESREAIRWDGATAAGSVFAGLDTPVGPVFVAYGFAEGGRRNFYLVLGQTLGLYRPGFWNQN